jgi:hypothetical protein
MNPWRSYWYSKLWQETVMHTATVRLMVMMAMQSIFLVNVNLFTCTRYPRQRMFST